MRLIIPIFLTIMVGIGCSQPESTSSSIPEQTFVSLYADRMILQEEGKLRSLDSVSIANQIDSLYLHYKVTRNQVEEITESYKQDINRWKNLHDLIAKRLEDLQQKETAAQK